jgi:ABC-2 type transport system permease protein
MQRRLDVALGLMHRPAVLFLDEPTTGLDPESRTAMWQEIARLAGGEGMTVLLTTHYLEEADRLASRLAIVDRGRVVTSGTPDELKGELRGDAVQVELPALRDDAEAARVRRVLEALPAVRDVVIVGRDVSARSDDGAAAVPVVLAELQRAGVNAASVAVAVAGRRVPAAHRSPLQRVGEPRPRRTCQRARHRRGEQVMTTMQMTPPTSQADARFQAAQPNTVPFRTTMAHTWYLTGRKLHALVRQPWVLAFSVIQPVIWLFLFGQLFRRVIDIPGFAFHGTYLDYLVPGLIAMNAMSNNMWAGMAMIEEIERGTLNRFLAAPASRIGIMNASVAEQAVSTTVQSLIIVGLGLAGGARYHGGVAGVAVMVAASILVGVVFGALSNAVGMTLRSREAIIGVYTFFMLPLMFLSSAFMQTSLMPGWMQAIASRNPLNWVVQIGRSAVSADPDWAAIGVRCGGLLVLAVACVAISVATFRSYRKNV